MILCYGNLFLSNRYVIFLYFFNVLGLSIGKTYCSPTFHSILLLLKWTKLWLYSVNKLNLTAPSLILIENCRLSIAVTIRRSQVAKTSLEIFVFPNWCRIGTYNVRLIRFFFVKLHLKPLLRLTNTN